jgi:hypothetical protein
MTAKRISGSAKVLRPPLFSDVTRLTLLTTQLSGTLKDLKYAAAEPYNLLPTFPCLLAKIRFCIFKACGV